MRIQVMSDIHLEFSPCIPPVTDADIVVLAGDIGIGDKGVAWAKNTFDVTVIMVPGNHEYYDPLFTMDEHIKLMKSEALGSKVHVLDNDVETIDGVRFIGTTLWTDLHDCWVLYSDADRIIITDDWHFNAPYAQALFEHNVAWLKEEIARPFEGRTVVISHHAPSPQSIHPKYEGNPWNLCFSSNLEELMGQRIDMWVHGHMHDSFDYTVSSTRVVCNPRGYPNALGGWENPQFNPNLVIDLNKEA